MQQCQERAPKVEALGPATNPCRPRVRHRAPTAAAPAAAPLPPVAGLPLPPSQPPPSHSPKPHPPIADDGHARLVKYYSYFGFEPVAEVGGGEITDLPHMLVWGGAGTRMDADVRRMLAKW